MTSATPPQHGRRRLMFALGAAALAASAPLAAAPSSGWGKRVRGDGAVTHQWRPLGAFSAIELNTQGQLELRLGEREGITIESDANALPLIDTVVDHGILKIQVAPGYNVEPSTLKFVVHAKSVAQLSVHGSGSISAERLPAPQLRLSVGGSGSIEVKQVDSRQLAVSIGGSGSVKAGGDSEQLKVSIGGSGRLRGGQLHAERVLVSIGGSGQALVWARQSLSANIAGNGAVNYYGDPQLTSSISGSGDLRRLAAAP